MSPKKILALSAAVLLAGSLAACGGSSDKESLTVVMWGGTNQTNQIKYLVKPWAKEAGVTIKQDAPTDYAKIKTQVNSGKVSWGAVQVEPYFAAGACEDGLLEKLPQRVVDAAKENNVEDDQLSECGLPLIQYNFSIGYNTEKFGDKHPTTWKEFFDTKTFPGKRGFWKSASGGALEAALLADGVKADDVYPLDLDRAFKKLDTIKKDIVWYDTGDQQVQLVSSGEAPLVQAWNGRLVQAADEGQPVANEYNQNFVTYEQSVVPKGYKNKKLAFDWMEWYMKNLDAQANTAKATGYGPASPEAVKLLPKDEQAAISGGKAITDKSALTINYPYYAKNYKDITERLNNWIAK